MQNNIRNQMFKNVYFVKMKFSKKQKSHETEF